MKYLTSRPETIRSIILNGTLPAELPLYLSNVQLTLFASKELALKSLEKSNLDQDFMLEINDSMFDKDTIFKKKRTWSSTFSDTPSEIMTHIDIASIVKIICFSERGNKLLHNLLKKINHPAIEIYSNLPTSVEPESPPKKAKTGLTEASSSNNHNNTSSHQFIQHLSTPKEHCDLLRLAFQKAKKTILITTYNLHHDALVSLNFYNLSRIAKERGVKIYIYYNDHRGADQNALRELRQYVAICDEAFTHSKFLCIDDKIISIGSFNWLASYLDESKHHNKEGTFVSRNLEINKDLLKEIWNHLRFYRNIQFENKTAIHRFEQKETNLCTVVCPIDQHSEAEYIPSLEQHCSFLQTVMEEARQKIIICASFVSVSQLSLDIDRWVLKLLGKKNVQLFFIIPNNHTIFCRLETYLKINMNNNIHLIKHDNFHLKTLIIDDNIIAEGSFNWLSATRNESSQFHNHEATLAIHGPAAKPFIEQFYQTEIGQKIINAEKQMSQTRSSSSNTTHTANHFFNNTASSNSSKTAIFQRK